MDGIILGIHLLTAHSMPGYETVTPGIYTRHESGFSAGTYRNSIGRQSTYAGWTFETEDKRWALTVGAVTGYQRKCWLDRFEWYDGAAIVPRCSGHTSGRLGALIAPSVKVGDARLSLVAFKRPAVHLSWEF